MEINYFTCKPCKCFLFTFKNNSLSIAIEINDQESCDKSGNNVLLLVTCDICIKTLKMILVLRCKNENKVLYGLSFGSVLWSTVVLQTE